VARDGPRIAAAGAISSRTRSPPLLNASEKFSQEELQRRDARKKKILRSSVGEATGFV
jgi:hypothetical protein